MPKRVAAQLVQGAMEFELQDADSLTEQFSRRFAPLKIETASIKERVGVSGLYGVMPGLEFNHMQFSGKFTLIPQQRFDAISFFFSTTGTLTFHHGRDASTASPNMALAADSASCDALDISRGHASSAIIIRRSLLVERLAILLGRPIIEQPRFEPMIDLQWERLIALRSLVSCITTPEFSLELNRTNLTAMRLRDMLVDMVLETWPNTYTECLRRPPPTIAPRTVKLAINFINEHPNVNPGGEELAALSGVSLRSLQEGFQRFMGSSITAYQRQVRLGRARDDLVNDPSSSIEEIARRWGFSNAGRFSRYFKEAYGVSPAELARQSR